MYRIGELNTKDKKINDWWVMDRHINDKPIEQIVMKHHNLTYRLFRISIHILII